MKCLIDIDQENEGSLPEHELTEERFLEQFAALEDGLALLQIHMRSISENAKLFGRLARQMRRSIRPTTPSPRTDAWPVPTYVPAIRSGTEPQSRETRVPEPLLK